MSVEVLHAFGNPNVGVYITASDQLALIPHNAPEKVEQFLQRNLGVEVLQASINNSPLLGVLCVINSNGLVIGSLAREEEVAHLKRALADRVVIEVLDDVKENAIGNLLLANDRGAIASPLLPKRALSRIADALDVEVAQVKLGGSSLVGAIGVANSRGALLGPLVSNDEVSFAASVLKVSREGVGTVNRGSVFIRGGIVANSKGAILGYETTGIEIVRIQSVLF